MSKVIICIHGRANKPEPTTLNQWWKQSIKEGLKKNTITELEHIDIHMAYYANIYYAEVGPVTYTENKEVYVEAKQGAIKPYKKGMFDRLRSISENWVDTPIDELEKHSDLLSKLARSVSKKLLGDLGEYYSNSNRRNQTNDRLKDLLIEHQHDEIILISHSMGTIVAYEVLRELGRDKEHQGFVLDHFITMGSPLGLTVVKGNAIGNHKNLRTPSCVKGSWTNFSDPQDFVCLDSHLADDYSSNSFSIKVKDVMVCNDYPNNEHKSYGYLRTPEFSTHLASLL
jgi:hypothetical protein